MSKFVIAKAVKGQEYRYASASVHAVSARSAAVIRDILNQSNYLLSAGEIWHIYEYNPMSSMAIFAETQRFTIRKGIVTRHYLPV